MKIILGVVFGLFLGAILATYERKWECDDHGYWRTSSFAYSCHRLPDYPPPAQKQESKP